MTSLQRSHTLMNRSLQRKLLHRAPTMLVPMTIPCGRPEVPPRVI